MKNTTINLGVVKKIAKALGEINNKVAFVGGAVISIYADDPAADDVRPTKDVDITLEIVALQEELAKRGFSPDAAEKVICRFKYQDVLVDVMGTAEIGWMPSNQWFKPGFAHLQEVNVEGTNIRILQISYFLATKVSAFNNRGTDPRTRHDFEDIVYILDNRIELTKEILNAPDEVRAYLQHEFKKILSNDSFHEAILGNLYYETQSKRFEIIMDKLRQIVMG